LRRTRTRGEGRTRRASLQPGIDGVVVILVVVVVVVAELL
jgi:hypothetical protein